MRSVIVWVAILIMVTVFASCSELPAAEVPESESEPQTEAALESETEKETESEPETESKSEWTPIPLSEKISWMNEIWPGWNDRVEYAEPQGLPYYQNWMASYPESEPPVGGTEVGMVMYSTRRQLVYEYQITVQSVAPLNPYCGTVINALEKGEPVYVEMMLYDRERPEFGVIYRIGKSDSLQGQSVFEGYALYLSDTPPEEGTEEEIPTWEEKAPVGWEEKEWMNDIWPDWKKWVDWSQFHKQEIGEVKGSSEFYGGMTLTFALRMSYGALLQEYYPEWENEVLQKYDPLNALNLWSYERFTRQADIDSATYIQTERIDRIMYATENQLVYYNIVADAGYPLREPYCGFVAGALEKGDAVRVVSVVENQQNPDDPVFYGIAYEPSLGTAPFMDSYINPFIELLDGLDPELTAFGFASKLSETPPTE